MDIYKFYQVKNKGVLMIGNVGSHVARVVPNVLFFHLGFRE